MTKNKPTMLYNPKDLPVDEGTLNKRLSTIDEDYSYPSKVWVLNLYISLKIPSSILEAECYGFEVLSWKYITTIDIEFIKDVGKLEDSFSKNSDLSLRYAKFSNKRFEKGEVNIALNPLCSRSYVCFLKELTEDEI